MCILSYLLVYFEYKSAIQKGRVLTLPSLHQAAKEGNLSELERALYRGVDVNEQAIKNGQTALHYAKKYGNIFVVERLLKVSEIETNIRDHNGNTYSDIELKEASLLGDEPDTF